MILATSYITIVIYSQIVKVLYKPTYYNGVGSTRRQDDDFASGPRRPHEDEDEAPPVAVMRPLWR